MSALMSRDARQAQGARLFRVTPIGSGRLRCWAMDQPCCESSWFSPVTGGESQTQQVAHGLGSSNLRRVVSTKVINSMGAFRLPLLPAKRVQGLFLVVALGSAKAAIPA